MTDLLTSSFAFLQGQRPPSLPPPFFGVSVSLNFSFLIQGLRDGFQFNLSSWSSSCATLWGALDGRYLLLPIPNLLHCVLIVNGVGWFFARTRGWRLAPLTLEGYFWEDFLTVVELLATMPGYCQLCSNHTIPRSFRRNLPYTSSTPPPSARLSYRSRSMGVLLAGYIPLNSQTGKCYYSGSDKL